MNRLRTFRFGALITLVATLSLLASVTASAQAEGGWTATGPLVHGRWVAAVAQIADGRVLVVGGSVDGDGIEAELFDPATDSWTATGNMSTARWEHTTTLLNDGRVLVAGGMSSPIYINQVHSSAEIFDPTSGTWVATGSMATGRYEHTATLLTDGRVLVAGGTNLFSNSLASAEIYDPATGNWSVTGSMSMRRSRHTATLLNDGRVLVVSGSTAEIYNTATGAWTATGSMTTSRSEHTATLLNGGEVLVAGGLNAGVSLGSAEIYNATAGTWSITGNMSVARGGHTATLLNDGRVLATGGLGGAGSLSSTEIFDPGTSNWSTTASMINPRDRFPATRLADGRVLVVGGGYDQSGSCCAELFTLAGGEGTPTPAPTSTSTPTPPPGNDDVIYVSSTTNGTAGGVSFADEDILSYDTGSGVWSMLFDGSDVGVNGDVDAFALMSDGSILFSLDAAASIGNLGTVADSDIVRFVPIALGLNTAGTFEWYFDGSDVGLTTNAEDIDAIDFAPDGRLIVSTIDSFSVPGASGNDEDLLAFMPISLGSTTSGTWALYFDGSDVGLNTSSSEDINGTWIDVATGNVYLSVLGAFSVPGASGDGADIFICTPGSLGATTACTFSMYWDGSANGFSGEVADGIHIAP